MESAAKRKASSAAVDDGDGRQAKRQKVPVEIPDSLETAESTKTQGLKFLDSLKQAKDKTGRPIATHFLTLPSKAQVPEYFEHVKLPIALDTIEQKLNNSEYTNLAHVESDCKRLVNNAKAYNDKKSIIYEDAERLRKTASNWMVKHNPAYRDGNYVAVATPIPGEENVTPGKPIPRIICTPRSAPAPAPVPTTSETVDRPRRAAAIAQATPAPSKLRHSASVAPEEDDIPDYTGKTFQQAQEQIVRELIEHEDGGLQIFAPFQNLPSRSLRDYYALIKDPMSLAAVQKRVRGVVGREAPTGHTLFKSWDAFEQAVSLIWKNARIYNEDGSDIYNLSLEFEEIFQNKFREAKAKVNEPAQPKLKLNLSNAAPAPKQQLKLKLRQSPASETSTPLARSSTPGIIVDNDALKRQQRHVLDSMGGGRSSRASPAVKAATPSISTPANPFSGPRGASATVAPVSAAQTTAQTRAVGSPSVLNGVKQDVHSPALSAIQPATTASDSQTTRLSVPSQTPHPTMAPPALNRMAHGSPHPSGLNQSNGVYATPQAPTYYAPPAVPRVDSFRKVPLKSIDEALIPQITLNTHPALNLAKPWSVAIPASKQKVAHSATIVVSPTNSYIQITPKVPIALTNRLYRLFVTVNGNRTLEVNRVPVTAGINGHSPGPGYEGGKKKGEPVFEAKLMGGVNRIEVEIVAEKEPRGGEETGGKDKEKEKDQIDVEKSTIFLHLMRHTSY